MERMSKEERYRNDPVFHNLVDQIYHLIKQGEYTPTEIREAAMLAQIKYECEHAVYIFNEPTGRNDMEGKWLFPPGYLSTRSPKAHFVKDGKAVCGTKRDFAPNSDVYVGSLRNDKCKKCLKLTPTGKE